MFTMNGYGPNGIAVIVEALTDNKTELQLMSEVHLLRAMEALVLRDVFPLCSMRRDRSLLTKKSVI